MPVTTISEARKAAARANGAKSRGPITSAGKAKSSRNSLTHGMTMKAILLSTENKEAAAATLAEFVQEYKPAGPVEFQLVELLALYQWQTFRLLAIEQGYFQNSIARAAEKLGETFAAADERSRAAESFRGMVTDDDSFRLLLRYSGEIRRTFAAKRRELEILQNRRAKSAQETEEPTAEITEIEPEPALCPTGPEPNGNPTPASLSEPTPGDRYPGTPRTALCPCRSGEKYKRCCGRQAPPIDGHAA